MFDRPDISHFEAVPGPPLPIAQLVQGKPVDEVAELLPRIFNLCPAAQGCAARLALGLDLRDQDRKELHREILRDHALRLMVLLPAKLELPRKQVDLTSDRALTGALFGTAGAPDTASRFADFLTSGQGIAPLLRQVADLFAPHEATCRALAAPDATTWPGLLACENSVAARLQNHPVLRAIETSHGRGPLWRITARALDAASGMTGSLPAPRLLAPGHAVVAAARGAYFLRAKVQNGRVAALERITPTDHMLVPGGILAQSLRSLPGSKRHLAQLVVDILDPCSPVTLREAASHA